MKTINIYSQEDMNKIVKAETDKLRSEMYEILDKLRERVINLEDLIRIYEGRIRIDNGKKK